MNACKESFRQKKRGRIVVNEKTKKNGGDSRIDGLRLVLKQIRL